MDPRRPAPRIPKRPLDLGVPPIAATQVGVFTAAQARAAGLSRHQVEYRLAMGCWLKVAGRGVAVPARPDDAAHLTPRHTGQHSRRPQTGAPAWTQIWTPAQRAWAARLTWADAVVGLRVAAAWHLLPVAQAEEIEVYAPARHRSIAGLRALRVPLPQADVITRGGLQLTTRRRTVSDCLAHLPWQEAVSLFAWTSTRAIFGLEDLATALRAHHARPGVAQLLRLFTLTRDGALSIAEHRLHRILRQGGLSGWSPGATIRDHQGSIVAVVDVLFEEAYVVIEVDGHAAHSSKEAFVNDRRRQNKLVNLGYRVLRFTWRDLTECPDDVLTQIREALMIATSARFTGRIVR